MPKESENPVQIEPLTKAEEKERGVSPAVDASKNPEYPEEWKKKAKAIQDCVDKGYKYYRRKMPSGKVYMVLRKGKHEKSLGAWSEEKEGKLFLFYPNVDTMGGIARPPPWTSQGSPRGRGFLSIPINRVAIIPRDYVPSINVIRYYQIIRENGFPGDFSQFINDVVTQHMRHCHGIVLPVLLEEQIDYRSDENVQQTTTER